MPKPNVNETGHTRACAVTRRAMEILGVPEVRDSFYHVKQLAYRRMTQYGVTEAMLLDVAAWAARRWAQGERAPYLKNLLVLWDAHDFASFLACARGDAGAGDAPQESDAAFLARAGITLAEPVVVEGSVAEPPSTPSLGTVTFLGGGRSGAAPGTTLEIVDTFVHAASGTYYLVCADAAGRTYSVQPKYTAESQAIMREVEEGQ